MPNGPWRRAFPTSPSSAWGSPWRAALLTLVGPKEATMASTEMSYGKAVRDELRVPTRDLRHAIPQVYAGYKKLHDAALAPGALDVKTKELIALAIAVSKECDGCIAAHT